MVSIQRAYNSTSEIWFGLNFGPRFSQIQKGKKKSSSSKRFFVLMLQIERGGIISQIQITVIIGDYL